MSINDSSNEEEDDDDAKDRLSLLPDVILDVILLYLPLRSVYLLGGTCRRLHSVTHLRNGRWKRLVLRHHGIRLLAPEVVDDESDSSRLSGIIRDPTLSGEKEVFLLYSPEFQAILRKRKYAESSNWTNLLYSSALSFIQRRSWNAVSSDVDNVRLALFGPGTESPETKHLIHKLVNSWSEESGGFKAVRAVPGLPGGFGSGVRIEFRSTYLFDLICLSSRGTHSLHPNVVKLLPTVQALCFTVDSSSADVHHVNLEGRYLRRELQRLLDALSVLNIVLPVLVLSCSQTGNSIDPATVATEMGLDSIKCGEEGTIPPWGVFDVRISDLKGMDKSIDWILYHIRKKRSELQYHTTKGSSYIG